MLMLSRARHRLTPPEDCFIEHVSCSHRRLIHLKKVGNEVTSCHLIKLPKIEPSRNCDSSRNFLTFPAVLT